jgi:hypothetical protein
MTGITFKTWIPLRFIQATSFYNFVSHGAAGNAENYKFKTGLSQGR